ncbi:small multi-drug export protein, partial [Cutibacterium acnes]
MEILKVAFLSAVPLIEQRGSIPLGIFAYKLDPFVVFLVSYLGSLLPVPFILLFFNYIFNWMKKYKIFNKINNIIENKIQKNSKKLETYKEIGLITFVAIPLP